MHVDGEIRRILGDALEGRAADKKACVALLELQEDSLEAALLKGVADMLMRKRFNNQAILLGQIGLETTPCPGDCEFCAFAKSHTQFQKTSLSVEEIIARARSFTAQGDLFALFLMTMHEFDLDHLLSIVASLRKHIPAQTQLVVNVGDFDKAAAEQLKAAGVNGAYHVCRLREGVDTRLDPAQRRRTIKAVRKSGLDFYYCCEPIGPEHTSEELVEQIFIGIEYGCFQHAAMRRVFIPDSPLAAKGQITERRLAQVVAVVALATLSCKETRSIAVHEPNLLGLAAGANTVYAETGANPRDIAADTSLSRGLDIVTCRKMLFEAGFDRVLCGDGATVPLAYRYPFISSVDEHK